MTPSIQAWVVFRIVAADKAPARIVALIGIRAVQQIGVKEQRRAGRHLTIYMIQMLLCQFHTFRISTGLGAKAAMFDAA
jgi:hypothetical protein